MHIAELNIGRFKYPTDDPRMAGFMDNLDLVNGIAERSPGFVWRLKDDSNNATNFRIGDDMAVNLSVWEDAASLEHFVFNTLHEKFYRGKDKWFEDANEAHLVFWYVPEGHEPTLEEAWDRLQDYQQNGATERAFGWEKIMDAKRMSAVRCAVGS
ncbi:DUF3291 domain-containing protein [Erythrobacter sp. YT30]|uniref:DUF3291 domain-containing protein n=1 Tax=Erythrobacter sp. YT30 TaxID=1735012 RepID=UPI00076BE42B|nr:DUF3291 domain-containing protein [Erythrobacter sp. YT30]KWV93045.1 hypothetical protein AUC45_02640 [Erythrobacter sp. YT30]